MRCKLKNARLRFRTKKLKIEAWVNDLMITNQSMKIPPINCFPVVAMPTKTSNPINDTVFQMDTYSATIGIDNRCTLCILQIAEEFVGELRESRIKIRGFGGVIQPKINTGTLLWRWEDDQGQEHKFLIPNYLLILSGKCRLLSPQHWPQTRQDDQKLAAETTDRYKTVLRWGNEKKQYFKTTLLGKKDNVVTFYLSPGFNNFHLFFQKSMDYPLYDDALAVATSMISDEEEDPTHHKESNHVRSWTPFSPDPHLPQPTLVTPDEDPEGVPQDDSETSDPEGEPEGATISNKDTPIGISFEEPPDDFSLPTSNKPSDPPSQS